MAGSNFLLNRSLDRFQSKDLRKSEPEGVKCLFFPPCQVRREFYGAKK